MTDKILTSAKLIDCHLCQDTGLVEVINQRPIIVCCGCPLENGECCGNGINEYELYTEQEVCEDCTEERQDHE